MAVVEKLCWQLGTRFSGRCRCEDFTVVGRFKPESMYGLSFGTKQSGLCRKVAVVERWPVVEVQSTVHHMIFSEVGSNVHIDINVLRLVAYKDRRKP